MPWWADDDPWRLSPAEQEDLDKQRQRRAIEAAETPETPPF